MSTSHSLWRSAIGAALVAIAVAALWFAGASGARAGNGGNVAVSPTDAEVGAGGSTGVDVVVTPPAEELSVWIINIAYDPAVVEVEVNGDEVDCTAPNPPASGGVGAASCDTKDTNSDQTDDTAVALGGFVKNEGGTAGGLDAQTTVATFNFTAVGEVDDCSDLTITVQSFLSPDPEAPALDPTVTNGQICIVEQSGAQIKWGDLNCDGNVDLADAIHTARFTIGLILTAPAGCGTVGNTVTVNGTARKWVDVNCDGNVDLGDAIHIARFTINLVLTPPAGCPTIGQNATVVV